MSSANRCRRSSKRIRCVRRGEAGGDGPARPCAACVRGRAPRAHGRARQPGSAAGRKAPSVPGSGCALRCTLPSALSRRGAWRPGRLARRASSRQDARLIDRVRVQEHRDRLGDVLEREVVRGAEARVVAALEDVRAVLARELRAAVVRADVDHDELRRVERRQQPRELRPAAVQDDDRGPAHREDGAQAGHAVADVDGSQPRLIGVRERRRGSCATAASASPGRVEAAVEDLQRATGGGRDHRPAGREGFDQHEAPGLAVGAVEQHVVLLQGRVHVDAAGERDVVGCVELGHRVAGERLTGEREVHVGHPARDLDGEIRSLPRHERAGDQRLGRAVGERGGGERFEVHARVQDRRRQAQLVRDGLGGGDDDVRALRRGPDGAAQRGGGEQVVVDGDRARRAGPPRRPSPPSRPRRRASSAAAA